MDENIDNSKLYELVLKYKIETEKNRDEINKYYTSLFAALVSFAPFIDKLTFSASLDHKYHIRYALFLISALGIILSISWQLTLKRIHAYLQGIDVLLVSLEKKINISFIIHMQNFLEKTHSLTRVTKHQIIIPYGFFFIFVIIFIYSLISVFSKYTCLSTFFR